MVKNSKGGKNYKKQKKSPSKEYDLIFREDDQAYARVIKQLGDGRFECQVFNFNTNAIVIGKIRGSLRKKVWINPGDIILVSTRSFDTTNCDIIHKYTLNESLSLKAYGEIPSNINLQATMLELAEGKFEQDENAPELNFEDV